MMHVNAATTNMEGTPSVNCVPGSLDCWAAINTHSFSNDLKVTPQENPVMQRFIAMCKAIIAMTCSQCLKCGVRILTKNTSDTSGKFINKSVFFILFFNPLFCI